MNKDKNFSKENLLMSVLGHLALIALMVTTLHFAIESAKLVAPDRVEITEIDLSAVQITRDKTEVYNTDTPDSGTENKNEETKSDVGDDKSIEQPSMMDVKQKNKEVKKDSPKKKTVVRVKRETASLNRTMTVSVVDALRVALTRCWVINRNLYDMSDIRAVAHLTLSKNGMVSNMWFESAARGETDAAFGYVLETIQGAVANCQPFKMLPVSEFDAWEKIQLTFYPTSGKIM